MGIILIVYAVIVLIDGALAFRSGGSRAALMMGSVSSLMLAISGIEVLVGSRQGAYFGFGVNAALVLVFARRYLENMKMMPAGLMLAVSVIVAAILYAKLFT